MTYWILQNPGASAVYFDASERLSLAELTLCARTLRAPCGDVRATERAGLRWLCFEAQDALAAEDIARVSRLSCLYALFEARADGALLPAQAAGGHLFSDSVSGILKYTGKTNALFTRFMLHVAELSLETPSKERIRVLDPVAGKGTTLYEALMRGFDASGIEIVQRAAHDGAVYFQKYLETEKWRHKLKREKLHGAFTWRFEFAQDKDTLKENPRNLCMVAGDAKLADRYFGKGVFDIIAGDLPYGVAHGNVTGGSLTRSPEALLAGCLPALLRVLRAGGVLALSWNTLVFPTGRMRDMLRAHGFTPLTDAPYDAFAHRVDAAIRRDLVIAVKSS